MYQVFNCVSQQHDFIHVFLAIAICTVSAASTLFVFHRGRVSQSKVATKVWAGIAGLVTGLGIWATHFVAMLGYKPSYEVEFDGTVTIISALIAVLGFVVTSQILVQRMSLAHRFLSAIIATASVAAMHYYGMSALSSSALIEHNRTYVLTSIMVSFAFFALAYIVGFSTTKILRSVAGVVATLLAVASLHFIGATDMQVFSLKGLKPSGWTIGTHTLEIWVAAAMVVIIAAAMIAASFDSFIARFSAANKRKLSILANSALESLFIVSDKGEIVEANTSAQNLLGLQREQILGRNASSLLSLSGRYRVKANGTIEWGERTITHIDGTDIPVEVSMRAYVTKREEFSVIVVRDLTERLRHEAEIRSLAYQDPLTGLANRVAFLKRAEATTRAAEKSEIGILLINIDGFQAINDQHTHEIGDLVLQEIAQRLQQSIPSSHLSARLGADEFAVLFQNKMRADVLESLAKNCLMAINKPIQCGGATIEVETSIGIVPSGLRNMPFAEILKAAKRAVLAAKTTEGSSIRLYDEALHKEYKFQSGLADDLARALERDEFVLHYQPKVAAESRRTIGYEALIRWNRDGHDLVYPDQFIPVAEQFDLIQEIGAWTIRKACQQAMFWPFSVHVSVNLSGRQLLDASLLDTVKAALKDTGLPAHRLELEITETALVQNTKVASQIINQLKALGVSIALDDFGTGYSSMSYVQTFQFDRIKIDRSFVDGLGRDKKAASIIEAIIYLGKSLAVPIVAEGVETEEQARHLLGLNCKELQGYLISKPMTFEQTLSQPSASGLMKANGARYNQEKQVAA